MEDFIKKNMNKISNDTKIKYYLSSNKINNVYDHNFTSNDIKSLLNTLSNYDLQYNNKSYLEYKYLNKILKISNKKQLISQKYMDIGLLDNGIISLLENKIEDIGEFEGLFNYNSIKNNQIITININKIIDLEISTIDNNLYQLNIIIPNQNIYYDKIYKIINEIRNNI